MITDEMKSILPIYEEGLAFYRDKDFEKAKECFQRCLDIVPSDGPSQVYLERCSYFIANPPPSDWDGVFVMTRK